MEFTSDLKKRRRRSPAESETVADQTRDVTSPPGMPLFLDGWNMSALAESSWAGGVKLQTKLKMSLPEDNDEREADEVADQFLSGRTGLADAESSNNRAAHNECGCASDSATCPRCGHDVLVSPKRKSAANHATRQSREIPGVQLGMGRPLDSPTRMLMESRFGRDFENVRVHTDNIAALSAEQLSAEAYTVGGDVVFAEGRYEPTSDRSLKLLAHELTHVVQQSGGEAKIYRDPNPTPANPAATEVDPCDVNVPPLTNAELVAQLSRTRAYLGARTRGQDDYYAYNNLRGRLQQEQYRRMRMGHVWLREELNAMPQNLYQLQPGAGLQVLVLPADIAAEAGPPTERQTSPVLTVTQFQSFLDRHGIAAIDIQTYFARQDPLRRDPLRLMTRPPAMPALPSMFAPSVWSPFQSLTLPLAQPVPLGFSSPGMGTSGVFGGGLYASPFDIFGRPFVSTPVYSPNVNMASARSRGGAEVNWRGDLPEMSFGRGTLGSAILYRDLNTLMGPNQRNFEVWDWRNRFTGDLTSVTHTLPDASGNIRWGQYDTKFLRAIGAEQPGNMTTAIGRLNAEFGTSMTIIDANQRTYLAINADHVDQYRTRLRSNIVGNPADYTNLFEALLRSEPARVGSSTFNNWNDLETARANGTITQLEFDAQIDQLSRRASLRVVSNGMTSAEILNMQNFRIRYQGIPEAQFGAIAAPELIEAQRFGGGAGGRAQARGASAMRGGLMGGATTAGIDIARIMWDPSAHPHAMRELAVDVPLGTAGGYGGSLIESEVNIRLSQMMLDQAATEVASGGSAAGMAQLSPLARGLGGTAAGGVIAPAVTMASMGIDELFFGGDYTYIDYTARGGRAFVSGAAAGGGGALGGALAAGLVGAVAGTEVPVVGNIVGFLVGIGIYYIVDQTVGEDVESGIRSGLGEGGCPRRGPVSRESDETWMWRGACFTSHTQVLMSDGTSRAISELTEGDEVLSFDLENGELRVETVLSLGAFGGRRYLMLSFVDQGETLSVTAEHPIYSEGRWQRAETLSAGAKVLRASPETSGVVTAEVSEVKKSGEVATVYNLSVSGCHTFFAQGVLVHNKNV